MKRSGATGLGVAWGVYSLLFGILVLFVLIVRADAYSILGNFISLAACLSLAESEAVAYLVGIGGFVLVIFGLVGVGMKKHRVLGAVFQLVATIGVFFLFYFTLLFGYKGGGGVFAMMQYLQQMPNSAEVILFVIISLLSLLFTLFGLLGAILSFVSPKVVYAGQYGQPYGQPYQAPYGQPPYQQQYRQQPQYQPPYQQPQYGQPYQQQYRQQPPPYGQQPPQYQPPQPQPQQPPQYQPPPQAAPQPQQTTSQAETAETEKTES